jgi:hypothetical protein
MGKEVTAINRAKEKPLFDWRVIDHNNEQERHNHGRSSQ